MCRKVLFEQKVKHIDEHNERAKKGEFSWTEGINQFTDMVRQQNTRLYTLFPNPRFNATQHIQTVKRQLKTFLVG